MRANIQDALIHEFLKWRITPAEACSELGWVPEERKRESWGVRGLLPRRAARRNGARRRAAVSRKGSNTMENTSDLRNTNTHEKRNGALYALLWIAAIAVIILSVVGIAAMMGVMPSAMSQNEPAEMREPAANTEPAAKAGNPRGAAGGGVTDKRVASG